MLNKDGTNISDAPFKDGNSAIYIRMRTLLFSDSRYIINRAIFVDPARVLMRVYRHREWRDGSRDYRTSSLHLQQTVRKMGAADLCVR